tara:strand:- start:79 stop:366 length:288 start_codon:yes stop_codon:yes gene_type:complete
MNGYKKGRETIQHCIDSYQERLEQAQEKFLECKNKNENSLAHGYDMQVICWEHVIETLRLAQTSLTRLENQESFDNNVVKIHEQTMEYMINKLTK